MLASTVVSFILYTIVLGVYTPPPTGGGGKYGGGLYGGGTYGGGTYGGGAYGGGTYGYGGTINGALSGGGYGSQRISTSTQAQNYANRQGYVAQNNLYQGQRVTAQAMNLPQNRGIPQANVRAGPHDSSQGPSMVTAQVPADPRMYQPPARNTGIYGAGSVAAHIPTIQSPGGTARIDPNRPTITQPGAGLGNKGNKDLGKTASYNPQYPYYGGYKKRDLETGVDDAAVIGNQLLNGQIAMRDLFGTELMSQNYWDLE